MRTTTALVATTAVCLALLSGCGGDAGDPGAEEPTSSSPAGEEATDDPSDPAAPPETSAPAEEVVITIEEFMYSTLGPVAPGTKILVENTDAEAHTVTADGGFDLTIAPGRTAAFRAPSRPGRYPYLCSFHAGMTSTLVVR